MRRRSGALLAAAVVLALTGCVGIPMSGAVSEGDVIDDQASPEFVVLPSDPVPGSSQDQILADFMQAVSSPQGGYAVAKKYLTSDLAATWHPDASAIIRTGPFAAEFTGPNSMTYSFSSRASVNEEGQYLEERDASSQSLDFVFEEEDGEWRIKLRKLYIDWRAEADATIFATANGYPEGFWGRTDPSYDRPLEPSDKP